MARTANPNTPEDGKALATQVTPEDAAAFRVLAMVSGKTVSDLLRDLVSAHIADNPVQITVGGKPFSATAA